MSTTTVATANVPCDLSRATDVTLLTSASDHRAVVVRRPDRPRG